MQLKNLYYKLRTSSLKISELGWYKTVSQKYVIIFWDELLYLQYLILV